jgi:GTPase SAR1 family protein
MAIINPLLKVMCFNCWNRFYIAECRIVSALEGNPVLEEAPQGFSKVVRRVWVQPVSGAAYLDKRAHRQCPHCGTLLPRNIEYMQPQVIGLVGAAATGKSHYIASLVQELKRGDVLRKIGCIQFSPLDQDVEDQYNADYYNPLFVDKRQLAPTPPATPLKRDRPLIYEMIFEDNSLPPFTLRRRVNLVLFDASGEDLEDEKKLLEFHRYVLNASALIFMVDPHALNNFSEQLPTHLRPRRTSLQDAFDVLNRIRRIYLQRDGNVSGSRVRVPIVMTLGKSDLLRFGLPGLGVNKVFWRQPDYNQGFRLDDFKMVDREVRDILNDFMGPAFVDSCLTSFPNLAFSAVSATGMAPDENDQYREIRPKRCLDPLLWILWRLGYIQPAAAQSAPATQQVAQATGWPLDGALNGAVEREG